MDESSVHGMLRPEDSNRHFPPPPRHKAQITHARDSLREWSVQPVHENNIPPARVWCSVIDAPICHHVHRACRSSHCSSAVVIHPISSRTEPAEFSTRCRSSHELLTVLKCGRIVSAGLLSLCGEEVRPAMDETFQHNECQRTMEYDVYKVMSSSGI